MSAPSGIVAALLPNVNALLGVRDSVGAIKQQVFFVTRSWFSDSGFTTPATQPEGYAKDAVAVQFLPSPGIKQFSQDVRLREGGSIKAGDIILSGISRETYQESDLDNSTANQGIEKLYMIGTKLYTCINVTQRYVTFNVQVRELTNQTRY